MNSIGAILNGLKSIDAKFRDRLQSFYVSVRAIGSENGEEQQSVEGSAMYDKQIAVLENSYKVILQVTDDLIVARIVSISLRIERVSQID